MRSGGFPCRFGSCDARFAVNDPSSVSALLEASERRTDHEVTAHGYHHQRLDQPPVRYGEFATNAIRTRRAARER